MFIFYLEIILSLKEDEKIKVIQGAPYTFTYRDLTVANILVHLLCHLTLFHLGALFLSMHYLNLTF